jgi:hypothetical protein
VRSLSGCKLPWAAVALIPVALAGCSVFSGWSDLQGGCRGSCDGGEGGEDDAGDASDLGEAGPQTVQCAGGRCGADQGCCVRQSAGGTCTTSTGCTGPTSFFVTCDTSSECPGGHCCFDYMAATCQPTCASSGVELCSPQDPTTCPSPRRCTSNPLLSGYYSCE